MNCENLKAATKRLCCSGKQVLGYFFEQVLAVYGLLAKLEEGFNRNNIVFMSDAIIFSWLIFITCNTAQRATDEVRHFLNNTIFCDMRLFSLIVQRRFVRTYPHF
jgi:hypothetical protein